MFGCLTYWAGKYKHEFQPDYSQERVVGSFDSWGRNLLIFCMVAVVLYIVQKILLKGPKETQQKRIRLFVWIDILIVGVYAVVWVAGSHIMPYADQYQVYLTAVEFRQGIYRDMEAYFYMCPQQYGLAFLYECVLWIWESYHLIQYINIVFLMMIYFFGYKIAEEMFEDPKVSLYTILVMNGFVPLILYVNFVYGEMGTIAMSLCTIWAVMRWIRRDQKRYMAAASVAMILAILVRQNMVIVTIALTIVLILIGFRRKSWKAFVLSLLLFLLPMGSVRAVELSYEARSGLSVGDGIPSIMVVAMGMQQSWHGAGVYNAYNHTAFWNEGEGDTKKAAQVAWDYIDGRVQEMAADLPATRYFYQSKIWEQWNEGSFGSIFMTNHFDATPFAPAQAVYGGDLRSSLVAWMDQYVFVIYLAVFIYCLHGLCIEKDVRKTIFPLIAIGGMIFSLLWENKSRYVLPYVVILLPAVAAGVNLCQNYLEKGISEAFRLLRKKGCITSK